MLLHAAGVAVGTRVALSPFRPPQGWRPFTRATEGSRAPMNLHMVVRWLAPLLGGLLVLLILLDVFMTVLYARIGSGLISHRLSCYTWRLFRWAGDRLPRYRDYVLCFCGPILL